MNATSPRADGPGGPARLLVLISGGGSNLQALLDACSDPGFGAEVVAVGADRPGVAGLDRAAKHDVPTFVCRVGDHAYEPICLKRGGVDSLRRALRWVSGELPTPTFDVPQEPTTEEEP